MSAKVLPFRTDVRRLQLAPSPPPSPESSRPRTRGECSNVVRPCPYVTCEHSLYASVGATGALTLNFPGLEPDEMPALASCALDIADQVDNLEQPFTFEQIADVMAMTPMEAWRMSRRALTKMRIALDAERTAVKP